MKYFKILVVLVLTSVMSFYSCNDTAKTPKEDSAKEVEVENAQTKPTTPTPTLKEPAQNTAGVWHYTCRIGCPGGAGTATKCVNCGNVLAHNTAYHGNASNTSSSPLVNPSAAPAKPATPEPAQNAAGVWHYTCSNGCAGGSGAAGNCGTCSGPLAHNTGYH